MDYYFQKIKVLGCYEKGKNLLDFKIKLRFIVVGRRINNIFFINEKRV